jgi:hypothetical protein
MARNRHLSKRTGRQSRHLTSDETPKWQLTNIVCGDPKMIRHKCYKTLFWPLPSRMVGHLRLQGAARKEGTLNERSD